MNRSEYLLACLAEECDEVGQNTMKALRFGLESLENWEHPSNAGRISEELEDLVAVATLCHREGLIPKFLPSEERIEAKRFKIETYMSVSRGTGALKDGSGGR